MTYQTHQLVHVFVTENKSVGKFVDAVKLVRVFFDHDLFYGYWVPEGEIFNRLDENQKALYLAGDDANFVLPAGVAQEIINLGTTPYRKQRLVA